MPSNFGLDSIPPNYTGGNIDNWRIGKGATMFYPVAVDGVMLVGAAVGVSRNADLGPLYWGLGALAREWPRAGYGQSISTQNSLASTCTR